jgi:AraC-like DNA-binding protein
MPGTGKKLAARKAVARSPLDQLIDRLKATHYLPQEFPAFAPGALDSRDAFIDFCRTLASALEFDLAREVRRQPFSWMDQELMCRCMLTCTDLEDAIGRAADFCHAVGRRGGKLSLTRRGATVFFGMDILIGTHSLASCLLDIFGLLGFQQLFGWLIGEPLRTGMIMLTDKSRDNAAPFIDLFNAPIIVNQPCSGIEFDAAQLSRPIVRNAAELKVFLQVYPFSKPGTDLTPVKISQQVGAYLDTVLAEGGGAPDIGQVARYLDLSEATLRRRLRAEAVSYQELKDLSQQRMAEYCLRTTDDAVETIARRLGFSNAASFRRAFYRWTTLTPAKFRESCW